MKRSCGSSRRIGHVAAVALAAALVTGCEQEEAKRMGQPEVPGGASQPAERAGGSAERRKATFAAGCFWGVEAAFRRVGGVVATTVGYTGGTKEDPTYKEVCTGTTGHAEAVQVAYDPARATYEQLLAVFWGCHDPTQRNRQGPDVGEQYRSAIFCHGEEQRRAAEATRENLKRSGAFGGREIVTEIVPAATFYPAEDYHQQYLEKRGLSSCHSGLK